MRTCLICKAAENPLGRLKFHKIQGLIYCDNCSPGLNLTNVQESSVPILSSPIPGTSAGSLVVIPCPTCRLMSHKPHGAICIDCSGYGSVRIPVNFLNVYQPPGGPDPVVLLED